MRPRVRENALCAFMAGAASAAMAWLGLYGFAWSDYDTEARPAFAALTHGHVLEFLRLAPAYGGSLVERAPFALLPGLWGGGQLAVYRMVALPCLLAAAILGVWLVAQMRARPDGSKLARAVALGICVANPLTLRALEVGHPEELLGGALCVAAVLLAARERPLWAGLALGLAIANKEWALLAVGPVLLALPSRRALCMLSAGAVAALVLTPLALVGSSGFVASTRGAAAPPSSIFQPWQVFWFLGHHGSTVRGLFGEVKVGYRTAPGWVGIVSHPLILAVSLPLTALAWARGRRGRSDALLLLALLLLLRCVLDTWDTVYYPIPFVLALLAWESLGEQRRPAMLALSSTVLAWVSFQWLPDHVSADAQAAFFLAWTVPLGVGLALRLYAPELMSRLTHRAKPDPTDTTLMPIRRRLPGYADAAVAVAMLGVLYYLAMRVVIWRDFFNEAGPAVEHLIAGNLHSSLALTPIYGGSLLLSAPALALGGALDGLNGAYRLEVLFCATAIAVLALALARIQRSQDRPVLSRWLLIGLLVVSPASDWALKYGHPEELLTTALCVGGMLLVIRGRITTGALLLGLAVASKQWALLALPIALAVTPRGQRMRFSALAGCAALVLFAPLALSNTGQFVAANKSLASAALFFRPQQIWWTLHLDYLRHLGGTFYERAPTAFVARYSRPLTVLSAILLGVAYWLRRRRLQPSDALLVLALVMLLRGMLDPWNEIYYQLPFLVSLGAWEVCSGRRAPLFTLTASILVWLSFEPVNFTYSGDITSLFYVLWALPAAVLMSWRSLRLPRPVLTRTRYTTTVSSLESRVSTS
jgi:Glycosyltransferase family 87